MTEFQTLRENKFGGCNFFAFFAFMRFTAHEEVLDGCTHAFVQDANLT
jgi:hypothetical protein